MSDIVSVVMPAYNSEDFIDESIASVVAQTMDMWELIIVDDASTDSTPAIIDKWRQRDARIRSIQMPKNSGAALARNEAFRAANGRYIALLDSDDLWVHDKLEKQLRFMRAVKNPLTYTAYTKINHDGHIMAKMIEVPGKTTYDELLSNSVIGCLTAVYDRQHLGNIMMPDVLHADYALWLKLLRIIPEARGLNESLAYYRIHKGSASRNKLRCAWHRWRVYRDWEGFSAVKSFRYIVPYAYHGLCKKYH